MKRQHANTLGKYEMPGPHCSNRLWRLFGVNFQLSGCQRHPGEPCSQGLEGRPNDPLPPTMRGPGCLGLGPGAPSCLPWWWGGGDVLLQEAEGPLT